MREILCEPPGESAWVDVCDSCGGVFIEFFDGESSAIARDLVKSAPLRAGTSVDSEAKPICPECAIPMHTGSYLGDGPEIERCGGCASLFMTRDGLEAMADYRAKHIERSSWLERVLAALGLG
jgi:hypothetical protein